MIDAGLVVTLLSSCNKLNPLQTPTRLNTSPKSDSQATPPGPSGPSQANMQVMLKKKTKRDLCGVV